MGNGVPNQGPFQHRQPGGVVVGYRYRYHDQQVTGGAWMESVEIAPPVYAALRAAAVAGPAAFGPALGASAWAPFFLQWRLDMETARLGLTDLR